ncbi:MAG: hypothetical protein WCY15_02445 [Phenylobacterium sp.]|jgi:hypothetical protein|uniref:hypothetical protein n=1 Tax=Phenylobacterium sp. TaxID=1871053 RepID=UPI002A36EDEE|nr:hypothetical protein [Phenylobacterium sp.]MDX9996868.1 hypothetical protein [Phenylobacterium sp.]
MPASPQPPSGGQTDGQDAADGLDDPAWAEALSMKHDPDAEAIARKLAREAASWEARRRARGDEG